MKELKEPKNPMRLGLKRHLILSGLTFNAEMEPVYTRAVPLDALLDSILEYVEKGELPKKLSK
jgi:hypothetical protein